MLTTNGDRIVGCLLAPSEYGRVQGLFRGQHVELVIDAVLAGNCPAVIWADDAPLPRAALLWDKGHCFYLAGAADAAAFNGQLAELLSREVLPQAAARGLHTFKVHYTDAAWEAPVRIIFGNLALTLRTRAFYTFDEANARSEPGEAPAGLTLQPIGQALLADREMAHVGELIAEIESMWPSLQRFLDRGWGLCLLRDREIVCRCTAEYVSGKRCGVGIETIAEYQNRGLATFIVRAFVAQCVREGIAPHWDCYTANLPSVRLAEKVGFVRVLEYPVWFGQLDPMGR